MFERKDSIIFVSNLNKVNTDHVSKNKPLNGTSFLLISAQLYGSHIHKSMKSLVSWKSEWNQYHVCEFVHELKGSIILGTLISLEGGRSNLVQWLQLIMISQDKKSVLIKISPLHIFRSFIKCCSNLCQKIWFSYKTITWTCDNIIKAPAGLNRPAL